MVLDTAPTGHTLLLMDATGAYHRQVTRQMEHAAVGRIITPLMRLQDPAYTHVVLVTLAEATPGVAGECPTSGPAARAYRALCLGHQQELACRWNSRPAACAAIAG